MRKIQRYGFKPGHKDIRDRAWIIPATISSMGQLPSSVDLRKDGFAPPILNQGSLGSCVWNQTARLFWAELAKQGLPPFLISRLMGYYQTRVAEGDVTQDDGCEVRDAMKVLAGQGVCPESEWPYAVDQFAVKPPTQCYEDAPNNKAVQYLSLANDLVHLKSSLVAGFRFIGGITVYESFESDAVTQSGIVPMPAPNEAVIGGHCVGFDGYDDNFKCLDGSLGAFIDTNTWDADWGLEGCFYLPYGYVSALGSDFWTLRLVS